jgi:hypothetical protein
MSSAAAIRSLLRFLLESGAHGDLLPDQKIEHVRELLAAYGNALRLLRVEPPA